MTEQLVYLSDYTDEVMPCAPTLEAWAQWLAAPDPDWGRPEAASAGQEFIGFSLFVLGDIRVDRIGGAWVATTTPPAGTEFFYLRWAEGSPGWDVEFAAETIEAALDTIDDDDGPLWLACTSTGPDIRLRFDAAGPALVPVVDGPGATKQ